MSLPETSTTAVSGDSEVRGLHFGFENTYARLPERFYARVLPAQVPQPRLVKLNVELAKTLGLDPDALATQEGAEIFAGNRIAEGSEPIALAYAGHQYAYFVPQLGDGRAILLGEVVGRDGMRYDIQLKGSGRTPFSRAGDGKAALGPVLREYIVSEAMAALGVPTTRSLAAVTTGELVLRETALPGAVLTRVAASHLRVGTFQYFAARKDTEAVRILSDYAIARHYPELAQTEKRYRAFLDAVIARHARLVAQWLLLGFVHGVMNTDNTSISGETIDYGPCAFMESYDPATVFSSIDQRGRYAYGNQPEIALWNLTRLAECLLPLIQEEESTNEEGAIAAAKEVLAGFESRFEAAYLEGLRHKLGLTTEREGDAALTYDLLVRMKADAPDFTLTFRRLCDAAAGSEGDQAALALFTDTSAYDAWATKWRQRLKLEPASPEETAAAMRKVNPAYIPRNHLVEAALNAAMEREDFAPFEEMLTVVSRPYEERKGLERYAEPARPEERVQWTFCGT